MFRKKSESSARNIASSPSLERITSVFGEETNITGKLTGKGGVRIEGAFEGEIFLDGLLVIGVTGRVTCEQVQANTVIVAGAVKGDIIAHKVEIRASGRIWGDVKAVAFSTEEGAFLRGQIQMEDRVSMPKDEEIISSEGESTNME
jgi:cytoskeletal protein CcmA (bactofilin family)